MEIITLRKTCAKSLHVLIISVVGIAFMTVAMPSIIFTLYFGEVSFISVKPFLVNSGACVISIAYISWPFSLLEAILMDVSIAGLCMTSCSLLTKNSSWWSIFVFFVVSQQDCSI